MKNKNVQHNKVSDGIDVAFSRELADQDDLKAQARADAADARQKGHTNKK